MPTRRSAGYYSSGRYSKQPSQRRAALARRFGRCEVCGLEKPVILIIVRSEIKSICEDCLELIKNK